MSHHKPEAPEAQIVVICPIDTRRIDGVGEVSIDSQNGEPVTVSDVGWQDGDQVRVNDTVPSAYHQLVNQMLTDCRFRLPKEFAKVLEPALVDDPIMSRRESRFLTRGLPRASARKLERQLNKENKETQNNETGFIVYHTTPPGTVRLPPNTKVVTLLRNPRLAQRYTDVDDAWHFVDTKYYHEAEIIATKLQHSQNLRVRIEARHILCICYAELGESAKLKQSISALRHSLSGVKGKATSIEKFTALLLILQSLEALGRTETINSVLNEMQSVLKPHVAGTQWRTSRLFPEQQPFALFMGPGNNEQAALAHYLAKYGRHKEALTRINNLLDREFGWEENWLLKGTILEAMGKKTEALRTYKEGLHYAGTTKELQERIATLQQ